MQGSVVRWCWGDAGIARKPDMCSAAGHAFTKYQHNLGAGELGKAGGLPFTAFTHSWHSCKMYVFSLNAHNMLFS